MFLVYIMMKAGNKLGLPIPLMRVIHGNLKVLPFLATRMMQSQMTIQEGDNSHGTLQLVHRELLVHYNQHGQTIQLAMKRQAK